MTVLGFAALIVLVFGAIVAFGTAARRSDTLLWIADLFASLSFAFDERLGNFAWDRRWNDHTGKFWKAIETLSWRIGKWFDTFRFLLERRALGANYYGDTRMGFGMAASPIRHYYSLEYEQGYDTGWDDGYARAQYDEEQDQIRREQLEAEYGLTPDDLDALYLS